MYETFFIFAGVFCYVVCILPFIVLSKKARLGNKIIASKVFQSIGYTTID